MKTIVTHIGPDLDAISAIWIAKTFLPEWEEAAIAFVPAGKTLNDLPPDDNGQIMHVDTGFGKFDHHQANVDTCAVRLVYEEAVKTHGEDEALERMTRIINDIDHFRDAYYPNPTADYWDFLLPYFIDGWRLIYSEDPLKIVSLGMECLDGLYKTFQNKVWAEHELQDKGIEFDTMWGKAIAIETTNDEVIRIAQKRGFAVAVRKDTRKGYLRIKALPKETTDLSTLYERLKKEEPEATWFLHASHHMILNGSTKNPVFTPSKKSIEQVIEVMKQIT